MFIFWVAEASLPLWLQPEPCCWVTPEQSPCRSSGRGSSLTPRAVPSPTAPSSLHRDPSGAAGTIWGFLEVSTLPLQGAEHGDSSGARDVSVPAVLPRGWGGHRGVTALLKHICLMKRFEVV